MIRAFTRHNKFIFSDQVDRLWPESIFLMLNDPEKRQNDALLAKESDTLITVFSVL